MTTETKAKYTPGPYRMHIAGSEGVYILPDTGDKREDLKFIAIVNGRDLLTDQANAKLFEQSWAMAELLRRIVALHNSTIGPDDYKPGHIKEAESILAEIDGDQ